MEGGGDVFGFIARQMRSQSLYIGWRRWFVLCGLPDAGSAGFYGMDEAGGAEEDLFGVQAGAIEEGHVVVDDVVAREDGELKILGAGLASSFGEAHFSLECDEVERLPFSVEKAVRAPYRHDAFQPRYLVSKSLEATIAEVRALTPERLLELDAGAL